MKKAKTRGAQEPPAMQALRKKARAAGFATRAAQAPSAVILAWAAPDEERLAASEWVRSQDLLADGRHAEHGPVWLGWALHAAFLAGIAWGRAHDEEKQG